jgi:hypothetical protein
MLKEIQQELKAPKNQLNKFGNYNYRSLEDILEAVKPILGKLDCSLIISDEVVNIGDRYYIKATAKLYTKDKIIAENTAYARESESKKGMDESQITGATSSYARKYCLNGLFAIDDTKDADATNTHDKQEPIEKKPEAKAESKANTASDNQLELIRKLATEKGVPLPLIIKEYNVASLPKLTPEQAKDCIDRLNKKENK